MRKLSLYFGIAIMLSSQGINAQDIFKQHGFDKKPLTLSNGRYNEFFSNDEIVQIGTVLLNTRDNQVVAFIEEDTAKVRYLSELSTRWLSPDPLAAKYPQVSPYVYVNNNPINAIDPDGRDAILVVWKNYPAGGYPLTGHAGVLLIDNKTGYTKYYEYGRYDDKNYGIVRSYAIKDVKLGSDGRPTVESMNAVFKTITEKSGTTHGKTYEMTGAYFESDKFKEMNDYAKSRLNENTNPDREKYSTMSNNCGDFATDVLKKDENIKTPLMEDPRPTGLIEQYKTTSDYNATYAPGAGTTVSYPEKTVQYNQNTNQTTTSQNWWQKLWYGSGE